MKHLINKRFQMGDCRSYITGASLIEVLIALALFSTCMLGAGMVCLQGLKNTHETLVQTQNDIQSIKK